MQLFLVVRKAKTVHEKERLPSKIASFSPYFDLPDLSIDNNELSIYYLLVTTFIHCQVFGLFLIKNVFRIWFPTSRSSKLIITWNSKYSNSNETLLNLLQSGVITILC